MDVQPMRVEDRDRTSRLELAERARARTERRDIGARFGLAALALVVVLSVPTLVWFALNWRVNVDGSWYLLAGRDLVMGRGYALLAPKAPSTLHPPGLPGVLGLLTLPLGLDVTSLVWALRLLALLNPLLAYFLIRRVQGPVAGLLAAGLVTFLGYTALLNVALNIDALMLTFFLLSVVLILEAGARDSWPLAALSGLAFGAAILVKETAIATLPMVLVAALLFDWRVRHVLVHYVAVVGVTLPWWIAVRHLTGKLYLAGDLPPGLVRGIVVAGAACAMLLLALWRLGVLGRLLGTRRRRDLVAALAVVTWTPLLAYLMTRIAGRPEPFYQHISLLTFVEDRILAFTPACYLFPAALLYLLWRTARGDRRWAFYLSLLVFQAPVVVVLLEERWAARQYLVPETLLYGALAGLMVALTAPALRAGWRAAGLRGAVSGLLILGVLVASGQQVAAMASGPNYDPATNPTNDYNRAVVRMHEWIAAHVPRGEGLLTTKLYHEQMAFLDDGEHRVGLLTPEYIPSGRVLSAKRCVRGAGCVGWMEVYKSCNALGLSADYVESRLDSAHARYLLVSGYPGYWDSGKLSWARFLVESGAYRIAHVEYLERGGDVTQDAGLVLLEATSRAPRPTPTLMTATSAKTLIGCDRRAHGGGYAQALRTQFPSGIRVLGEGSDAKETRATLRDILARR